MFCFISFLIVLIVIVVISSNSKDKKSNKQLAKNEELLKQIPDMYYVAREMTSAQRALNLWPRDKDMLDVFQYKSDTREIYLKMKDGRSISCPLADLDVGFGAVDRYCQLHCIIIRQYDQILFTFYEYAYTFTDEEWNDILATLTFAGTTRNVAIMSERFRKTQKGFAKMNRFLNILKHLS